MHLAGKLDYFVARGIASVPCKLPHLHRMSSQSANAIALVIGNELTIHRQPAKFLYHGINLEHAYAAV